MLGLHAERQVEVREGKETNSGRFPRVFLLGVVGLTLFTAGMCLYEDKGKKKSQRRVVDSK